MQCGRALSSCVRKECFRSFFDFRTSGRHIVKSRAFCPWERLGVSQNCTIQDAKSAYRRLMLEVHPDLNRGDERKAEQAVLINQAYVEVLSQLAGREMKAYDDPFDQCEENPQCLFVNPLLCHGVSHTHWHDLQLLAQNQGEGEFQSMMMKSEGLRIPDEAFLYLTKSQHSKLMEQLEIIQCEFDSTAVQAFEFYIVDCLSRARKANI